MSSFDLYDEHDNDGYAARALATLAAGERIAVSIDGLTRMIGLLVEGHTSAKTGDALDGLASLPGAIGALADAVDRICDE